MWGLETVVGAVSKRLTPPVKIMKNLILTILVATSLVVAQCSPAEPHDTTQVQFVAVLAREESDEPHPFGV